MPLVFYYNEIGDNVFEEIRKESQEAFSELVTAAKLKEGSILVIGCSTSEIGGGKIGTQSNEELAKALFDGMYNMLCEKGIYLACQCCEHLNRALVIENELAQKYNMQIVNVVPQPKAGGSLATTAYKVFKKPVLVEHIKADAGIDIGGTLIGMHLKETAVPLRLNNNKIGEAQVFAARTRPKFIGGIRAVYDENLL